MRICLAGEGAQGKTYMETLRSIDDVEVVTLAGGIEADMREFAAEWNIPHSSLDLKTCLTQPGVEAVFLTTPSQDHAAQTELALSMGKHVMVEIPMALNLADSERLAKLEQESGLVCMVAHSRRYNTGLREIKRRLETGELHLHHVITETYFFRRENTNRFGKPRTWADDLLWHHGCHLVDQMFWLFDEPDLEVWGQVGPNHPQLDIPMDLTIGMRSKSGCLVSAALSFNNHGPLEVRQRLIGEEDTLLIQGGQVLSHTGEVVAEANQGIGFLNQCREFFAAIATGTAPPTSLTACLPTMALLERIQRSIEVNQP